MISLVLVRHAETAWVVEERFQGLTDVPLSPRGEEQARTVGRRLADTTATPSVPIPEGAPVGIWHSSLERAAATARAIAEARAETALLMPRDDLIEVSGGAWEGLTATEIVERWPTEYAAWRRDPSVAHPVGGEAPADGAVRVQRAVTAIVHEAASAASDHPWAMIVSHDGVLRLALLGLLGLPLTHYWSFPFSPAAVSVVEGTEAGIWRLRSHGA
ncbi:MAG: histidine phosphatase family protein [Candidatus Limnocylindrales bacterium]